MTKEEALRMALEALDNLLYWDNGKPEYDEAREAITAIRQALAAPVQDASKQFHEWAVSEHATLTTTPPAAQRTWVGLTDEQVTRLCKTGAVYAPDGVVTRTPLQYREELENVARTAVRKAEAKLMEKNT